ncbi:MAG: hypothetical protein Q7S43_04190 [bacterium]|nr:hypothetical protein [bacterium]
MSSETILRQFYVSKRYNGDLSISQAEARYGVEIRPLSLEHQTGCKDLLLKPSLPISVEGDHDNVYRLFDLLCPGTLRPEQRKVLGLE